MQRIKEIRNTITRFEEIRDEIKHECDAANIDLVIEKLVSMYIDATHDLSTWKWLSHQSLPPLL